MGELVVVLALAACSLNSFGRASNARLRSSGGITYGGGGNGRPTVETIVTGLARKGAIHSISGFLAGFGGAEERCA